MTPLRIQLRRTKGWRMPANTVKVCRPGQWGNPFVVGQYGTAATCVAAFSEWFVKIPNSVEVARNDLGGRNLACWCRLCDAHKDGKPLSVECSKCEPCHADILGRIADA